MKIGHLLESKVLLEGGNLSINGHEAQHLDLKVTQRAYMVPKLNLLLNSINNAYAKIFKEPLWSPELLASGKFLSGSSLHFFDVKGIDDETFIQKKPTVGDIDTMVDKEKELNLQDFLNGYQNKKIGPAKLLGFQRGNEQFSALFEMQDPPVKVQIDFEFVKFDQGTPTDWARFSHSSSWEDIQQGVKGVFHKWLIQAFTSLTRKDFYLRKMVGRGKLRKEEDIPTTDNMWSFAVSSKEGGGLRAKYEPVIQDGKPLMKDGLPVMTAAPAAGYQQDIGKIFSTILGEKLSPQEAKALANNFWSYSGLLQVMNKLMTPEEKQQVLTSFLEKSIGPGAQGMYKNNPDKDIQEKTTAINLMLKTLNLPAPSNLKQMLDAYRKAYKMTGTDEGVQDRKDTVKSMAKRTLDEAGPNYKRQGIQHIYNPGSTVEMKDLDFINFCKEIAADGGKFEGVPINLKVDGAGIRFGRDEQGKPFFMTSRVDTPMYIDNYGDFESYARRNGQEGERLAFTKNYDEALKTILTSEFMKDVPPDTIVQAEMLFNPMAKKTDQGYEFVNIPYDPAKLGSMMTLVPISVKEYSTGQPKEDAAQIKKQLIKDSTKEVKLISNTLPHKGINVSKIVNPIVKNADALEKAVSVRGTTPEKEKAKLILSKARQALSNAIINSKIPGMDQLGNTIEGLVINMPSGTLAKVTSPDMQAKMAAKLAANKKPTTGSNRVKPAVVTIGSFAGHKGHQQLIDQTIATAKSVGGDPYIYVSPVMGPEDPIPADVKLQTLRKLYPEFAKNIQVWDPRGNPVKKIEKELVLPPNSPYNKVILLVGDDRYESFKNWMDSLERRMKDPVALAKYGGTQNQVDFETVRTERDPTKGGTGISFTQLRNILKDPNKTPEEQYQFWSQAFDSQALGAQWIKSLMDVTRKNMGMTQDTIKEYIARIKPLLPHASAEQKQKIYEQLSKLKEFAIDKEPNGDTSDMDEITEGLDYNKRQQIIQFLAKKMGWEVSYLELASDANLISWYKKVQAGKNPMSEGRAGGPQASLRKISAPNVSTVDYSAPWVQNALQQVRQRKQDFDELETGREKFDFLYKLKTGKTTNTIKIETYQPDGWGSRGMLLHIENYDPKTGEIKLVGYSGARNRESMEYHYTANTDTFNYNGRQRKGIGTAGYSYKFTPGKSLELVSKNPRTKEIAEPVKSTKPASPWDILDKKTKVSEDATDIFNLADPETQEILKYAQRHYPDAPNAQSAFMKFVIHSLKHSEEDDREQDAEIAHLDKEVDDLEHKVDLSESNDYLDEK